MNNYNIKKEIEKINNYINKSLWMFMDIAMMNPYCLEIVGRIDQSCRDILISIKLEYPMFICGLTSWETNKNLNCISLVENKSLINNYKLKENYKLFKFGIEDLEEACTYVSAFNIKCKIYGVPNSPK